MMKKIVEVGYGKVRKVKIGGDLPLAFVGGPCAIENRDHALFMADKIATICFFLLKANLLTTISQT